MLRRLPVPGGHLLPVAASPARARQVAPSRRARRPVTVSAQRRPSEERATKPGADDNASSSNSSSSSSSNGAAGGRSNGAGDSNGAGGSNATRDVECIGTGMETSCTVSDWAPGEEPEGSGASPSGGSDGGGSDAASALGQLGALLLLVSPFFFWGSSMVAMKVLGPHTSPIFVGAFRLIPAGAALIAWAAWQGRPMPSSGKAWLAISVFALFDGTFFQGFLAQGLQRTSAGLGSLIIDSQPITVALLASLFLGERLTPVGYGGLALGVLGLLMLELPPSALTEGLPALQGALGAAGGESGGLWDNGEWWMLLAAQSMALGTVLVPWVSRYSDPVMATGWHLLLGGLPLAALSIALEGDGLAAALPALTPLDAGLLLYVSLLGSAASYGVFFYNASRGNLTSLSALTFLTPCFAAGLGYALLGEALSPLQLAGGAVTLGAVTMVNRGQVKGAEAAEGARQKRE